MAMRRMTLWIVLGLGAAACRGQVSSKPPIHPLLNMFFQPKYLAQDENPMFPDRRAMRPPVPGTVARGTLAPSTEWALGTDPDGQPVWLNPAPITVALLERGRERFDIYCAPCHDRTGGGKGMVIQRQTTFAPPPPFTEERIRTMPDGEMFNVITHGVRTMPSYRHLIPVEDRWAIVAYVRALQRSQQTTVDDLPADLRARLDQ